jgi:2-polyprenyl-3-methyl-5-hydroxy-6-metoxy-1,4-benzoquinol methylase
MRQYTEEQKIDYQINDLDLIIRDQELVRGAVNYRKWLYTQFSKYLGRRVIEMGAGIGNFAEMFLDKELVVAVDNHKECVEYMKRRFTNFHNVIPVEMDISDPHIVSLSQHRPDTVVCINVLEHVKDDAGALSYISEILRNGGRLILIVPAFQFLYGSIDYLLGHHRRYSKKELTSRLCDASFVIKEMSFINSIAVIGWFLNNRILKRKEESLAQVLFFDRFVVPWLKTIEKLVKPPFGLSLFAIGEKEGN